MTERKITSDSDRKNEAFRSHSGVPPSGRKITSAADEEIRAIGLGGGGVASQVQYSPFPPESPTGGELWNNTGDVEIEGIMPSHYAVWDGGAWVDLGDQPPSTGSLAVSSTVPPANPQPGQLWFNSDVQMVAGIPPSNFASWDGSQWVPLGSLLDAQLIPTSDDAGLIDYASDGFPPASSPRGKVWRDVSFEPPRWKISAGAPGGGTPTWIELVTPLHPDEREMIGSIDYEEGAIAPAIPLRGDVWRDSSGTPTWKIYDGTEWIELTSPPSPAASVSEVFYVSGSISDFVSEPRQDLFAVSRSVEVRQFSLWHYFVPSTPAPGTTMRIRTQTGPSITNLATRDLSSLGDAQPWLFTFASPPIVDQGIILFDVFGANMTELERVVVTLELAYAEVNNTVANSAPI